MVIPGFLAGDIFTRRLRRTLAVAGYRPLPWGCGINWGVRSNLIERLLGRIEAAARDAPVVLVGWSLGGLYAREAAKLRPALVERVVTLGSPFSGDLRANRAWRLYELVNGHAVDRPPIEVELAVKPPVPTFALWSRHDGVVAPAASRGNPGESDRQIEIDCRHMDFCSSPAALAAILDAIAAPMTVDPDEPDQLPSRASPASCVSTKA